MNRNRRSTAAAILGAAGMALLVLAGCSTSGETAPPPATTQTTTAPPANTQTTTAPPPVEPPPVEETTADPEPSNCKPLTKRQLSEIAAGIESGLARVKSGVLVPLSTEYQFGFDQVVALRLTGGRVATFVKSSQGGGQLMAINGPARKYFQWGPAVEPGSPLDDGLQAVKDSDEYAQAVACLER
jgi:hypothetical protein